MIRRGIGVQSFVSAGGETDADAQAFITAAGITDATQQSAINTLVTDLKGYGIWTKMKAIYPFVGGTSLTHKWNLKDPRDLDAAFRLVFSGGGTHASTGWTPNGVNGYADTFFVPSNNFTANNNNHVTNYIRNINNSSGTFPTEIGCYSNLVAIELNFTRPNFLNKGSVFLGDSTVSGQNFTGLTVTNGMLIATNLTTFRAYNNAISIGQKTVNSSTLPNFQISIGANRNSSTTIDANTYSAKECAFASMGDGLTDTEAANLYTTVQAYQTTLGRQV